MPYSNQVFAGRNLVIPAIQSPNYVAGLTGWSINRDGTIEVNNGIFRGSLVVGSPPGAGGTINSTVPAVLTTYYGNSGITVASVAILLYPGDNSYHYEILGTDPLGNELWACGWVDTHSVVFEYEQHRLNVVSSNLLQYAFGNGTTLPGNRTQWTFGNSLGASKTGGANVFAISDTLIVFGVTGDIGGFTAKIASAFEKTLHVLGVLTADVDAVIGGPLTLAGSSIYGITTGTVSITPSGAGVATTAACTFATPLPVGRTYIVVPSARTVVSCQVGYSSATNTGCNLTLTRATVVATFVDCIAIAV